MATFKFSCELLAVLNIEAPSEDDARLRLLAMLDAATITIGDVFEGYELRGEASLSDGPLSEVVALIEKE